MFSQGIRDKYRKIPYNGWTWGSAELSMHMGHMIQIPGILDILITYTKFPILSQGCGERLDACWIITSHDEDGQVVHLCSTDELAVRVLNRLCAKHKGENNDEEIEEEDVAKQRCAVKQAMQNDRRRHALQKSLRERNNHNPLQGR